MSSFQVYLVHLVPPLVIVAIAVLSASFFKGKKTALILAILTGVFSSFFGYFFGIHFCDEGTPPLLLSIVFGLLAGACLYWLYPRSLIFAPLVFLLIIAHAFTTQSLAGLYHSVSYTGNPDRSTGEFWHTFITGIRLR